MCRHLLLFTMAPILAAVASRQIWLLPLRHRAMFQERMYLEEF